MVDSTSLPISLFKEVDRREARISEDFDSNHCDEKHCDILDTRRRLVILLIMFIHIPRNSRAEHCHFNDSNRIRITRPVYQFLVKGIAWLTNVKFRVNSRTNNILK